MESKKKQWELIYEHIQEKPITTIEAVFLYSITRLAEIVRQVEKNTGKQVKSIWVKRNKKRFKRYYL